MVDKIKALETLTNCGIEYDVVSWRGDNAMAITYRSLGSFEISEQNIVYVKNSENVDKEKAVHLTVYQRSGYFDCIVRFKNELLMRAVKENVILRPFTEPDAEVIGNKASYCLNNTEQLSDSIISSGYGICKEAIYVGGKDVKEISDRILRLIRIAEGNLIMQNVDKYNALSCFKAQKANRNYVSHNLYSYKFVGISDVEYSACEIGSFADLCYGRYGYYAAIEDDKTYFTDVKNNTRCELNDKSRGIAKFFYKILEMSEFKYVAAVNSFYAVLAGAVEGDDNVKVIENTDVKQAKNAADYLNDGKIAVLREKGAISAGKTLEEAINKASEAEEECRKYITSLSTKNTEIEQ